MMKNTNQSSTQSGRNVGSTIAWIIAVAPVMGFVIQMIVSVIIKNSISTVWYITLILNVALCILDESLIREAGYKTEKLFKWVFIPPVYLTMRAKMLKERAVYALVWGISFILMCIALCVVPEYMTPADSSRVKTVQEASADSTGEQPATENQTPDVNIDEQDNINENKLTDISDEPAKEESQPAKASESSQEQQPDSTKNEVAQGSHDMLFDDIGSSVIEAEGSAVSQGTRKEMSVDVDGDGEEERFVIERESPNGIKIAGIKNGQEQNFLYDIKLSTALDEYNEVKSGYYVETGCVDIDNDGSKEVIVSIGNKLTEMETLIYKVNQDAGDMPYELVGHIEGQEYMYLDENKQIIVPYGSRGLFDAYVYSNGEIKKA